MKCNKVLLASLISGISFPVCAQGFNSAEIDAFVSEQIKSYEVPGLSLAIVKDGKVLYTKGYGVRDIKTNVPVNADTLFSVASNSKSFTALGVMQQVNAGKLELDKPINTYLPKLKFSDATKAPKITLRRLLSLSTGLPSFDDVWLEDPKMTTRQQLLDNVAKIPFTSDVGAEWQYSNQNIVIAGTAIEAVTGQTWEAYTKANIFAPLGMNRSVFSWNDTVKDGNYTSGHSAGPKGVEPMAAYDRWSVIAPTGAIHSSATEMARYLLLQLSDGRVNGKRVVSKQALTDMHTPQIQLDDFPAYDGRTGMAFPGYGMGWFTSEYRGLKVVEHGGNIHGFSSSMQLIPERGLGIQILTNANTVNDFLATIRLGITERILNLQPRSDFSQEPYLKSKQLAIQARTYKANPADLKKLEGTYSFSLTRGASVKVIAKENGLLIDAGRMKVNLAPASPTEFAGVEIAAAIRFAISPDGNVWLFWDEKPAGVRVSSATVSAPPTTDYSSLLRFDTQSLIQSLKPI
jgi:CubicO group peptidase (beta-lactamase class C family)